MLGLTATLGQEGGRKREELESLLGEVVYAYSLEDAQVDGIIPDFEWTVHPTALEASEAEEWERKTKRITDLFQEVRYSSRSTSILDTLDVPFNRFEDLGDFIRAHKVARIERDHIPDSWENLHAAIMSRNVIRHRSRPKLDAAIELANDYLTAEGKGIKIVMFTMNIDMVEEIDAALSEVCDHVYPVHSEVAASNAKKDRIVRQRIDRFKAADNGVLIAPKLLDEGIDVPDAEVGINVAGTKTELQLIQRMGRILRRHGNQKPHFHHYVAVPEENHLDGVDAKEFAKQMYWVRELGERIGQQPSFETAGIDPDIIERAKRRGNELWAEELFTDTEVQTIDGPLKLQEILDSITPAVAETLLEELTFDTKVFSEQTWEQSIQKVRQESFLAPSDTQQIWWLYPIYQDDPKTLERLLRIAHQQTVGDKIETTDTESDGDRADQLPSTSLNTSDSVPSTRPKKQSADQASPSVSGSSNTVDSAVRQTNKPDVELSERDLRRLHDIADLAPTKNAELCSRWGYDSGSELYSYLRNGLMDYFERNECGFIVLNEDGEQLVSSTNRP